MHRARALRCRSWSPQDRDQRRRLESERSPKDPSNDLTDGFGNAFVTRLNVAERSSGRERFDPSGGDQRSIERVIEHTPRGEGDFADASPVDGHRDVGHAARAGTNLVEAIHAAGPRLYDMHVKDLTNFSSKESQVPVGEGILPFREMFEALIKIGYQGFIDLEYEIHPDDPMPGVIESFAFMRGVLDGMGYLTHA